MFSGERWLKNKIRNKRDQRKRQRSRLVGWLFSAISDLVGLFHTEDSLTVIIVSNYTQYKIVSANSF